MSEQNYMKAWDRYRFVSSVDERLFEPIRNLDVETAKDYKSAAEILFTLHVFMQKKIDLFKESEESLLEGDLGPFETEFEILDRVRKEDAIFVLEGLETILFESVLYVTARGLEDGTIQSSDLNL